MTHQGVSMSQYESYHPNIYLKLIKPLNYQPTDSFYQLIPEGYVMKQVSRSHSNTAWVTASHKESVWVRRQCIMATSGIWNMELCFSQWTSAQSIQGNQIITLFSTKGWVGNDAYISLDFSIKGSDFEIDRRAIIPPLLHSALSLAHTSFITHSTTRSVTVNTDSWSHLLLVYQQDSIYLSIVTSEVTQHSSPRIQSSWKISIKYFLYRGSCLSSPAQIWFCRQISQEI